MCLDGKYSDSIRIASEMAAIRILSVRQAKAGVIQPVQVRLR
jgi:hypothetical protein